MYKKKIEQTFYQRKYVNGKLAREKMLTSAFTKTMQMQTPVRCHCTRVRMAQLKDAGGPLPVLDGMLSDSRVA